MKMGRELLIGTIVVLLLTAIFPIEARAGGQSAVGVLNVGPSQITTRIVPQDNTLRVYLVILDYNSWEDIFEVSVILEYYGKETATFTFRQYNDTTTYVKSNTFTETSTEGDLLSKEKSIFSHSDKKETVDDKCNLNLTFVFRITWFTHLKVIAKDRGGLEATTLVEYSTEDLMRSSNMIVIPWIDGPILVGISSLIINLLAIVIGAIGALYFAKKMNRIRLAKHGTT
ncbi:MAG: hypothetical protein JSW60_06195 [Thermoplasmatales archaeon]|nr:MAG: hypothetical protein JSW60_06195 [Thermoplasmatales archaeon]